MPGRNERRAPTLFNAPLRLRSKGAVQGLLRYESGAAIPHKLEYGFGFGCSSGVLLIVAALAAAYHWRKNNPATTLVEHTGWIPSVKTLVYTHVVLALPARCSMVNRYEYNLGVYVLCIFAGRSKYPLATDNLLEKH